MIIYFNKVKLNKKYIITMYKTVFKACFRYLTSFDVLDGFTSGNEEFCEP
ncbi:MAG: hypothetical protein ACI87X_000461 [Candidatus Arcticimaribacter sp.]